MPQRQYPFPPAPTGPLEPELWPGTGESQLRQLIRAMGGSPPERTVTPREWMEAVSGRPERSLEGPEPAGATLRGILRGALGSLFDPENALALAGPARPIKGAILSEPALEQLLVRNYPKWQRIARKMFRPGFGLSRETGHEDLLQEGAMKVFEKLRAAPISGNPDDFATAMFKNEVENVYRGLETEGVGGIPRSLFASNPLAEGEGALEISSAVETGAGRVASHQRSAPWREREDIAELAERFGVTEDAIRKRLQAAGTPTASAPNVTQQLTSLKKTLLPKSNEVAKAIDELPQANRLVAEAFLLRGRRAGEVRKAAGITEEQLLDIAKQVMERVFKKDVFPITEALQRLHTSPVREKGLLLAPQAAVKRYLEDLRALVSERRPDLLPEIDKGIEAFHNGEWNLATQKAEGLLGYLHMDERWTANASEEQAQRLSEIAKTVMKR
mgnify:CR=1 FL=1